MKKAVYLLFIVMCLQVNVFAQKCCPLNKKEFREKKQTYLSQKARLTAKESLDFFPLYFELQDKKEMKNRALWKDIRKSKESELSETEYNTLSEKIIKNKLENYQLDMEYLQKYKKVLSSKKIYEIQRAEMRFHRELLRTQSRHRK